MAVKPRQPEGNQTEHQRLYDLVVIGASAGGIEALSTVMGTLTPDFPAPIVVAQHLDPRQPSHLEEILARRSALPVRTVADQEPLAPGVVYVVPADRHVEISDGHLRLHADTLLRPKPSVNLLFSSAAKAFGERLVAVIVTGTGTDGAAGAREVKAAGGTVVIENPATAAHPGMPASLAPTTVDLVADLEQIGPLLHQLLSGAYVPALPEPDVTKTVEEDEREQALQAVLAQVREHSGIDFSNYKRPTILRRLQRRMVATGTSDLSGYARHLDSHPDEYQRLVASFLINVTEFFRDSELYDTLRDEVLPDLIAHARAHGSILRIWSAGCATGEEPYSLAILLAEALGEELEQFRVQIFATDLDEEAITFARQGIYTLAALAGLSEALIARYFTRLDGTYEVNKQLRGLVVFGQHDLGQRPPFPHIDLVLCRNVLIYFTPELQTRALQLFAFALRDGGYLALGKAETVQPLEAYFVSIHRALKLYRRQGERVLGPISLVTDVEEVAPRLPPSEPRGRRRPAAQPDPRYIEQAQALRYAAAQVRTTREWLGNLVLGLSVGVVVVNRRYDIQAINSIALRLLGIYIAAQGEDLIHLTQTIPTTALRAAIDAAFRGNEAPGTGGTEKPDAKRQGSAEAVVTLETVLGERRHLHITCHPYPGAKEAERAAGQVGPPRTADVEAVLILIEDVTGAVREQEQITTAAGRHYAAEETRLADERLDRERSLQLAEVENARLKEEMNRVADVNRSLLEANQSLSDSVLELRRANEELLVGHEEAQASAEEVKTLNEELQATNEELVTMNEEMEATVEELRAANDDLHARSRQLQQSSEALAAERATSDAKRAQLEAILLSLGDAVLVVDPAGAVVLTNAAYDDMFAGGHGTFVAEDEVGRPLSDAAAPQQRAARGETFTMEFTLTAADGMRRWFEATGQPIRSAGEARGGIVAIRDITERSLQRLENEFLALASHELRTPLTSLSAYLQLLSRLLVDQPENTRVRLYAARALHEGRRLTRLVQDLLDVNRLQGGRFALAMERVQLDEVVAQTVEAAQTLTTGQTIHLERPNAPLFVKGDAMRLEQVLLNLLTNAIAYAPRAKQIDVRVRRDGSEAEVRVRDHGAGIPAAELPHIFLRFYQVTRSDADRPALRGLGLGLYIAHELVEAHGGRIEVSSIQGTHEGHGTTFTIRLPLATDRAKEQPRQERRSME